MSEEILFWGCVVATVLVVISDLYKIHKRK